MALIFTEGFDVYGTAVKSPFSPTGCEARRGWSGGLYVTEGRIDGYSASSGFGGSLVKSLTTTETTKTIGFAFRMDLGTSAPSSPLLRLYDGTTLQVELYINASGALEVKRGTTVLEASAAQLQLNRWYYVELQTTINNSTGAYELKLDGASLISDTGVDTQESANAYWDKLVFYGTGEWHGAIFDDIYVTDSTGAYNTGFLGTVHIQTLFPDADVTSAWTPSAGSDHYALVDENPVDDDTTYVEDNVSTNRELFDMPALTPTAMADIRGVTNIVDCRVTDASSVDMKMVNVSNVTDTAGATQTISSQSFFKYEEITEQDPDAGAPWTKTTLEAAQFGFEVA